MAILSDYLNVMMLEYDEKKQISMLLMFNLYNSLKIVENNFFAMRYYYNEHCIFFWRILR